MFYLLVFELHQFLQLLLLCLLNLLSLIFGYYYLKSKHFLLDQREKFSGRIVDAQYSTK